ncbi:MAG: hypothetical protein NPINA01_16490 [Nitrospinaceae bacterium]|nr:MAG: hypothetical protein NPINA01_16490 [Nitrospinaceae bacterium]
MKFNKVFAGVVALFVFAAPQAMAEEGHQHKPYVGSQAFEQMKGLVGSWEGTMDAGKGPEKVALSYKLTAFDSALVETVFEGTPHEMVSVYHDDSKRKLTMTHYCSEHNQPKLTLTSMKGNQLNLDLSKDSDIDVAKEAHIHAASIQFDGKDKVVQRWTSFEGGKERQVVEIAYKRVQ